MKVGTKMDPNELRRGRGRGFFFDPKAVELVEIPEGGEDEGTGISQQELEDSMTVVNPDEPEPDDPDAA